MMEEPERTTARPQLAAHHQRLLAIVRAEPGLCLQELADRIGLTRTAAIYHVRNLSKRGYLSCVRQGRRVMHFVPDATRPPERTMLGLLRLTTVRTVLDELHRDPGVSWRTLARKLDMAPHTIRWHVSRLRREGVLEVLPRENGLGREVRIHPTVRMHLQASPQGATPVGPEVDSPMPPTAGL